MADIKIAKKPIEIDGVGFEDGDQVRILFTTGDKLHGKIMNHTCEENLVVFVPLFNDSLSFDPEDIDAVISVKSETPSALRPPFHKSIED